MDRNINADGRGKYALVLMRNYPSKITDPEDAQSVASALMTLESYGMLDYGQVESPSEFFLIRLKDKYAGDAIRAYADAVQRDAQYETDEAASKDKYQWALEVLKIAGRAGDMSLFCKQPD